MANATPSRFGQVNSAGDAKAQFLQLSAGEILAAFTRKTAFMSRHRVRSIPHGKAVQFEALGRAAASYHIPGEEILGQAINGALRTITIDDLLKADVFIANVDEAMSHFSVRQEYAKQLGEALAIFFDTNVARVGILAARAAATVTGLSGGTAITAATAGTNADAMVGAIYDAAQALEEKDVPRDQAYVFVRPAHYFMLVESTSKLVNRDYSTNNGGVDTGVVLRVAGIPVVMTNRLPNTDDSALVTIPAAYRGNFLTTVALVMHPHAVGTATLIDLAVETQYDVRRQGTLMLAKKMVGHGILRPECSVEIRTS